MTIMPRHYRTIWISDIHLGTRGCKAEFLLDFLRQHRIRRSLSRRRHRRRLAAAPLAGTGRKATTTSSRRCCARRARAPRSSISPATTTSGCATTRELAARRRPCCSTKSIHETADGRRLLVHAWRRVRRRRALRRWLAHARRLGLQRRARSSITGSTRPAPPRLSLLVALRLSQAQVKNAVEFIGDFGTRIVAEARKRGVDGVVCGHIHHAEIRDIDGVLYCNDGDWVESCTALVEHDDGRLEILHWASARTRPADAERVPSGSASWSARTHREDRSSSPTPGRRRSTAWCAR